MRAEISSRMESSAPATPAAASSPSPSTPSSSTSAFTSSAIASAASPAASAPSSAGTADAAAATEWGNASGHGGGACVAMHVRRTDKHTEDHRVRDRSFKDFGQVHCKS